MIWGGDGAWSAAYGIAIVLVNFAARRRDHRPHGAHLARRDDGGVLFGYLLRLGLIFLAVWVVKDAGWISLPALGATIIVTHLGLLVWELKYVALSLTYPGLKPAAATTTPAPSTAATRTITTSPPTT